MAKQVALYCNDFSLEGRAQELAREIGCPFLRTAEEALASGVALRIGGDGITLTDGNMELRGDFARMAKRLRRSPATKEMVVRAAKVKHAGDAPLAVDATAGLGEDGFLLASAGFRVHLYERDPIIAAMLDDAMLRGLDDPATADTVARMTLFREDSIQAMRTLDERPAVVLLDPMFPARRKSAAVKKKFQLLHHLESPATDEEEMVAAALDAHPAKIVIKRPPTGPYLGGIKPSYSLESKAIRYDVIVPTPLP